MDIVRRKLIWSLLGLKGLNELSLIHVISIEFVNNKTKNKKQSLTESLTMCKTSTGTGMFGAIDEIFHHPQFTSTDGIYTIPS